jgi:hypothetical protein
VASGFVEFQIFRSYLVYQHLPERSVFYTKNEEAPRSRSLVLVITSMSRHSFREQYSASLLARCADPRHKAAAVFSFSSEALSAYVWSFKPLSVEEVIAAGNMTHEYDYVNLFIANE